MRVLGGIEESCDKKLVYLGVEYTNADSSVRSPDSVVK
jgi:hypothetical protein